MVIETGKRVEGYRMYMSYAPKLALAADRIYPQMLVGVWNEIEVATYWRIHTIMVQITNGFVRP